MSRSMNRNMMSSDFGAISNMDPLFAVTRNAARNEDLVCSEEKSKIPIALSANSAVTVKTTIPILRRTAIKRLVLLIFSWYGDIVFLSLTPCLDRSCFVMIGQSVSVFSFTDTESPEL